MTLRCDTTTSTCCSTPANKDFPISEGVTDAGYLTSLATYMLEYINHHELDAFKSLLVENCDSHYQTAVPFPDAMIADSLVQHLANVTVFFTANPNYHIQVQNSAAEVDDILGRAMVFLTSKVRGILGDENVTRETICSSFWKRRADGRWVAIKLDIMRGPGDLAF